MHYILEFEQRDVLAATDRIETDKSFQAVQQRPAEIQGGPSTDHLTKVFLLQMIFVDGKVIDYQFVALHRFSNSYLFFLKWWQLLWVYRVYRLGLLKATIIYIMWDDHE